MFWGMPLDVVIAPAEDCFWPDLQTDTDMRLKIRVRRMKEGRELRGVYPHGRRELMSDNRVDESMTCLVFKDANVI